MAMNEEPRVFIVQERMKKQRDENTGDVFEVPKFDFRPAANYGRLEVLLPDRAVGLTPGPTVHQLRQKLKDFSDQDYLLTVGDPTAIAIAVSVASQVNNGRYRLLNWDRDARRYIEVAVDINQTKRTAEA